MSKSATVRTRKRGKTYSYIFEAGKTPEGKRKVIEKGGYPTKQAAYDAGVAAYNDWKHGNIGITSEKITVREFMTNWLENIVAPTVKSTTLIDYRARFKSRILPYIGNFKMQEVTPAIIDNWMRKLLKTGLSWNSLSNTHSLLSHAFSYAVYPADIIQNNPVAYIKIPRSAPKNIIKRQIISIECFQEIIKKYPVDSPYHIPLLILFHTGIRLGELLGLTWEDVNLNNKIIKLNHQIAYIKREGNFFTTLKTESSNRKIIIDDFLVDELQQWQHQQLLNEESVGESYIYIYRNLNGKMIQQSKGLDNLGNERVHLICTQTNGRAVSRTMMKYCLEKENLNSHSFRHTHATMLIENGATPKGVAGRLGHADTSITENIYTHNTEKIQENTIAIFEKIMQTKL